MPRFPVATPRTVTLSAGFYAGVLTTGESLALPAETLKYATHLAQLLGPMFTAKDGSVAGADVKALAAELARVRLRNRISLDEAYLDTATYLLNEYEAQLGLALNSTDTTATRRQRLVAKWRALRGAAPKTITRTISALLVAPAQALVVELPVGSSSNPLDVYRFAVVVPDTGPGWPYFGQPTFVARVEALLDEMKPVHTLYTVTNQVGFKTDDPASVTDRTLVFP